MTKSINDLFKEKGWIIKDVIPKSEVLSQMMDIESEKTLGKDFTEYSIIPAEITLKNTKLMPKDGYFLLYVLPTEEYRKKYNQNKTKIVFCKDQTQISTFENIQDLE